MKIRIKANTIRFRLVKSEVKQLFEQGRVEEVSNFPSHTFTYRIETKPNIEGLETDFLNNTIVMYIPEVEAKSWYHSDRITYKNGNVIIFSW